MDDIVKFGNQVVAALSKQYGKEAVSRPNVATVRIQVGRVVNDLPLRMLHREYLELKEPIDVFLKKSMIVIEEASKSLESHRTWAEIEPHLTMAVRSSEFEDSLMLDANTRSGTPPAIRVKSPLPGLWLTLGIDSEHYVDVMTIESVLSYGKSVNEAIAIARAQTLACFPKWVSKEFDMPSGKRLLWACDGNYGGTVVNFSSSWKDVPIPSDHLWVACPYRSVSLAFDSHEKDPDLPYFADFVRWLYEHNSYPVSRYIYGPRDDDCIVAGATYEKDSQGPHKPT